MPPIASPPMLQSLQHVMLEITYLHEASLRQLAGWLPCVQSLEVQLTRGLVCNLGLLSRLHADELLLKLWLYATGANVDLRLDQLGGVRLHSLIFWCYSPLTPNQEQLLRRCCITESVVLRSRQAADPARQLQRLPSGAAVLNESDSA